MKTVYLHVSLTIHRHFPGMSQNHCTIMIMKLVWQTEFTINYFLCTWEGYVQQVKSSYAV